MQKLDRGYRLPPPPGCPRAIYRIMVKCWCALSILISRNPFYWSICRNPDPRSRLQFGQITKLLTGNGNYLLGWSDEDKQVAGEDDMKLGAPLECANNLYYDLHCQCKHT